MCGTFSDLCTDAVKGDHHAGPKNTRSRTKGQARGKLPVDKGRRVRARRNRAHPSGKARRALHGAGHSCAAFAASAPSPYPVANYALSGELFLGSTVRTTSASVSVTIAAGTTAQQTIDFPETSFLSP